MNRLELTWVGKENRPRLEPRILLEETVKSYHATGKVSDQDTFDNRLIHGDNLLALKALQHELAGAVKCVFIDPPYNTGSAFEHYDDGLEHSLWLGMMRERLELLRRLLRPDGSIWITIDDNEGHYLKVLCDEVFGRSNFVGNIVWQKRYARDNNSALGNAHDHILLYAMNYDAFKAARNLLELDQKTREPYRNPNNDPAGPWQSISFTGAGFRPNQMYTIVGPDGTKHVPPEGRHWATLEPEYQRLRAEGRFWFGQDGKGVPRFIRYLSEVGGLVPSTWWPHDEVGHNDEAKKEIHALFGRTNAFDTPKPERLLHRIIQIATNPGDIVLDSFAGSGTTGAVAHKMGRRWIMIELGDQADALILPRMQKVIAGEDSGGITAKVGWKGGGGFRFYRLAPSLLERDEFGNWVVSQGYNSAMLAEAVCKLEGYRYEPSDTVYWQHGKTSGETFIYVTTQTLTVDQLRTLNNQVGPSRSLLVCCGSFTAKTVNEFSRLVVKKIPKAVLHRCEWGQDDYSLEIKALPEKQPSALSGGTPATKDERRKSVSLLNYAEK